MYETIKSLIASIRAQVQENTSILELRAWFTKNMATFELALATQADSKKDNLLEIVASLIVNAVTVSREDLIHLHMNTVQITEYSAARMLEQDAEESGNPEYNPYFPDLVNTAPDLALQKATQVLLGMLKEHQKANTHDVACSITLQLRSMLREVLRYPPQ